MNNHLKSCPAINHSFPAVLVMAAVLLSTVLGLLPAGAADATNTVPLSWVDPDTGHRVFRLTREPGSDSFYFNINCFTPDGTRMVYSTPGGISVLNLKTLQSTQVVAGPARAIIVGHKFPNLYYTRVTAGDPHFH